MTHSNGNGASAGPTVVDAASTRPSAATGVSTDYVLSVHRCEHGFTATLRARAVSTRSYVGGDAGPLATAVAATAGEAMVAAIAAARLPDASGPLTVDRGVDDFDPPTL